jgi:hypothetical protein
VHIEYCSLDWNVMNLVLYNTVHSQEVFIYAYSTETHNMDSEHMENVLKLLQNLHVTLVSNVTGNFLRHGYVTS